MNGTLKTHLFKSSDKKTDIYLYNYIPFVTPLAVLQIVHGMCEYTGRYEHFISYLLSEGIAVVAHDHLGHGNSVLDESHFGYFDDTNGYCHLVTDLHKAVLTAKHLHASLPHIIFAHSMGTFVTKLFIANYKDNIDAVILCGTSGSIRFVNIGILYANLIIKKYGAMHRSKVLEKLAFKDYNARYTNNITLFDWLTRDESIIDTYMKDKFCTYIFTASAFRDLFTMIKLTTSSEWYKSVPKNLPIFLVSGSDDPVGRFGKGVTEVYDNLVHTNVNNVQLKIYDKCRHELVNELNKEDFFKDTCTFIKQIQINL